MKMDSIKDELFKLMNIEKNKYYSSKVQKEINRSKESYAIYREYYLLIVKDDSFSSIYNLREKIANLSNEYEEKYNELLNQYKELKDPDDIKNLASIINPYVYKIDALNTVYNIINKKIETENKDVIDFSNSIVDLIIKFDKEKDSSKKEEIMSEIYRLKDERRTILLSNYSDNILDKISALESVEFRIARSSNDVVEPYKIDKTKYFISLRDTIKAINDYYFIDYKNSPYFKKGEQTDFTHRFNLYIRKYHSYIKSLFKNSYQMIEIEEGKISTDDLLNYLSIYNIDNNYELFKSKYRNSKIGDEVITRDNYIKSVLLINKYIEKFIEDCSKKFRSKSIIISDENNEKEELMNERKSILYDNDKLGVGNKYGGTYEFKQ